MRDKVGDQLTMVSQIHSCICGSNKDACLEAEAGREIISTVIS